VVVIVQEDWYKLPYFSISLMNHHYLHIIKFKRLRDIGQNLIVIVCDFCNIDKFS
jgi:hypothetical protein